MPEIDESQKDAAFDLGYPIQVTSKILGMNVDQGHQFFHQPMQGKMTGETGDDDQQPGAAAGQNPDRFDFALGPLVPADGLPQAPAGSGIERVQAQDSEEFVEGMPGIVERLEAARGGGDQGETRFGLQRLAQPPSEVVVDGIGKGLKIFHHKDQMPIERFARVHDGRAGSIREFALAPAGFQVRMRCVKFARQFGGVRGDLVREIEQRFEPEVGKGKDLMAFLHEPYRQEAPGAFLMGPEFGGEARQQHGLAAAARRDDQDVLARRRVEVFLQDPERGLQLDVPDRVLRDHLAVGLKKSGVEFADRRRLQFVHRESFETALRFARGAWLLRKRSAHQSRSKRKENRWPPGHGSR